jgi:hypothetical protein
MLRSLVMDPNLAQQMMQMITGGVVAQSIAAAAELGIADQLAVGEKSSAQLAALLHTDEEKLHRLLRFLASLGIFQLNPAGAWQLTPLARLLLDDEPGSVRAGARMLGGVATAIPFLTDTIRTGTCAYNLAYGKPLFEDLQGKPELAAIFDAAMNSFHGGETEAVLSAYSFNGVRTLADIGGGAGAVMIATLHRYPALNGILFDQPDVLQRTSGTIKASGLDSRCTLHPGSFFESIPAGADAYHMRHIIHDWPDDQCIRILSNVRKVIPANGRLLLVESVIPEGNDFSPSKLFDMLMMTFPDGKERTEAEYRKLFAASGFALHSVTPTHSPVSVIDARPI